MLMVHGSQEGRLQPHRACKGQVGCAKQSKLSFRLAVFDNIEDLYCLIVLGITTPQYLEPILTNQYNEMGCLFEMFIWNGPFVHLKLTWRSHIFQGGLQVNGAEWLIRWHDKKPCACQSEGLQVRQRIRSWRQTALVYMAQHGAMKKHMKPKFQMIYIYIYICTFWTSMKRMQMPNW